MTPLPADSRTYAHPMSTEVRPCVVCLPSWDADFASSVDAAMVRAPESPPELEYALRSDYPSVKVRESELSGLRSPTWYAYRDGHFPWPS